MTSPTPGERSPAAAGHRVLLLSTYDLGRQPRVLVTLGGELHGAGFEIDVVDTSIDLLTDAAIDRADLVAIHLPMHTASRLAAALVADIRGRRPGLPIVGFGLYADLDPHLPAALGLDGVLGASPVEAITGRLAAAGTPRPVGSGSVITPPPVDRSGLPALSAYARLRLPDGGERLVGSLGTTTGCAHRCRHCPVAAVHGGRFRAVPVDQVLAEVDELVAAGAQHLTFADPDFLNGPVHARRVVEAVARRHPGVTYDVTVKVEHLLRHAALLPVLAETGCVLVTSAFESIDDGVLALLDKGHTVADLDRAVELCGVHRLALAPTWVPFTPWTTRGGFVALLDWIGSRGLVDATAPVQYGIRLLVTAGSLLLTVPEVRALVGPYDPALLAHPWHHAEVGLDELARQVMATVSAGETAGAGRQAIHRAVRDLAAGRSSVTPTFPAPSGPAPAPPTVPYLTEPWFC